jgi:hypothetical protein
MEDMLYAFAIAPRRDDHCTPKKSIIKPSFWFVCDERYLSNLSIERVDILKLAWEQTQGKITYEYLIQHKNHIGWLMHDRDTSSRLTNPNPTSQRKIGRDVRQAMLFE